MFFLFLLPCQASVAENDPDLPCLDHEPISVKTWTRIRLEASPVSLGSWKLGQSDVLASAYLQFTNEKNLWKLIISFHFGGEFPYGIPYSFQFLRLEWKDSFGVQQSMETDWSDTCRSPGRSLFPQQILEEKVSLNLGWDSKWIQQVELKVWANQN